MMELTEKKKVVFHKKDLSYLCFIIEENQTDTDLISGHWQVLYDLLRKLADLGPSIQTNRTSLIQDNNYICLNFVTL